MFFSCWLQLVAHVALCTDVFFTPNIHVQFLFQNVLCVRAALMLPPLVRFSSLGNFAAAGVCNVYPLQFDSLATRLQLEAG